MLTFKEGFILFFFKQILSFSHVSLLNHKTFFLVTKYNLPGFLTWKCFAFERHGGIHSQYNFLGVNKIR